MEYRGQVIPVIRLSQIVPPAGSAESGSSGASIEVVIHSAQGHTIAVIVDCIVDIVGKIQRSTRSPRVTVWPVRS